MIHISEQEVNSPKNVSFCDSHLETRIQLENRKNEKRNDQGGRAVNFEGRKLLITQKRTKKQTKVSKTCKRVFLSIRGWLESPLTRHDITFSLSKILNQKTETTRE